MTALRRRRRGSPRPSAYHDANRAVTYEATGMSGFVTTARNTGTVTPLDEAAAGSRSRLSSGRGHAPFGCHSAGTIIVGDVTVP